MRVSDVTTAHRPWQTARKPVATSGGWVYCKECLYGHVLEQKKQLERKLQAYKPYYTTDHTTTLYTIL